MKQQNIATANSKAMKQQPIHEAYSIQQSNEATAYTKPTSLHTAAHEAHKPTGTSPRSPQAYTQQPMKPTSPHAAAHEAHKPTRSSP